jgi:hypothetical protein
VDRRQTTDRQMADRQTDTQTDRQERREGRRRTDRDAEQNEGTRRAQRAQRNAMQWRGRGQRRSWRTGGVEQSSKQQAVGRAQAGSRRRRAAGFSASTARRPQLRGLTETGEPRAVHAPPRSPSGWLFAVEPACHLSVRGAALRFAASCGGCCGRAGAVWSAVCSCSPSCSSGNGNGMGGRWAVGSGRGHAGGDEPSWQQQ